MQLCRSYIQNVLVFAFPVLLFAPRPCSAQDASCKVVMQAANAMARVPHHTYSTNTSGGKSVQSEAIATPAGVFIKVNGGWRKSPRTFEDEGRDTAEGAKAYSGCRHLSEETIGGEPASVYSETNTISEISGKVWISKTSGLPLKSELQSGSGQISIRVEYSNVQPPAVTK